MPASRCFSLPFLLAVFFLTAPLPVRVGAAQPQRNILLLIADDLGRDCGCYGNSNIKMPNLDALAARGVYFTHAFACVSSCSPSRATIYTGLHTHTNGQYGLAHGTHNQHTFPHVKSLPTVLRAAGYRTGIIGKVHVLPKEVYPFEVQHSEGDWDNRNVVRMAGQARQFFTDSGDKPFLLVMGYNDPHRSENEFKEFGNHQKYPGVPTVRYDPKDVRVPEFLPDQPEVRAELAQYYQSASRLDHGIGLVLQALKETKKADSTLVIFLSDNGIAFPGAKNNLYDSGIRLPFIVSSPVQKKHGLRNDAMVSFVDVMPTALDWAGIKGPAELQGRSILPILESEHPQGWDLVYGSHQFHEITMYYPMRMVRTRTHKYILNLAHKQQFPFARDLFESPTWQGVLKRGDKRLGLRDLNAFLNRPREELYDLEKDPHELKNLAADPGSSKVIAEFRDRLKKWQVETKDRWVSKYKYE